jgi:hypothetical protein
MKKHLLLPSTLLAIFLSETPAAMSAEISISIFDPLKGNGQCLGQNGSVDADYDRDCLDDFMERSLAEALSPYTLWDEGEDCDGFNLDNPGKCGERTIGGDAAGDVLHFKPRISFQVTPTGKDDGVVSGVKSWSSTDGKQKFISVKYFLNYPHQNDGDDHVGDSERVRYNLYTFDLKTFFIYNGRYNYHASTMTVSGQSLFNVATKATGCDCGSGSTCFPRTLYPVVESAENSHASFAGDSNTTG